MSSRKKIKRMSDSGDEAVAFTCLDLDCEPIRYIIDIVSHRLAIQVKTVSATTSSKSRHTFLLHFCETTDHL